LRDEKDAIESERDSLKAIVDRIGSPGERATIECRLVAPLNLLLSERSSDPDYSLNSDIVSFADGFTCLLISEASLRDLNSRAPIQVSMRRFRPNLVISGCGAFEEDRWRRLRIGSVEFAGVKNCSRCILTTIDPDTSQKHERQEPLRTLGSYRRRPDRSIDFGQNLIPRGSGTVRLGDPIEILETG